MDFQIVTSKATRRNVKKVKPEHYLFMNSFISIQKVFQISPIRFIPTSIITHIMNFLDAYDLLTCKLVSNKFNELVSNNQLFVLRIQEAKKAKEEEYWKKIEEEEAWNRSDSDDRYDYDSDEYNITPWMEDHDDRYI